MKKQFGARRVALWLLITALLMAALSGCGATDTVIKLGKDEIPTMYAAVGERSINGTESGFENDMNYTIKTFASGAISEDDIETYWQTLKDAGFIATKDSAMFNTQITAQLGRESVEEGKIIIIDIEFDSAGETVIEYRSGEGTLTRY